LYSYLDDVAGRVRGGLHVQLLGRQRGGGGGSELPDGWEIGTSTMWFVPHVAALATTQVINCLLSSYYLKI
jgi:hypothetical protein